MDHPENLQWIDMAAQIQKVVASCKLGERLFGFALKEILSELVEKAIDKQADGLIGHKNITSELFMEHLKKAKHEVDNIAGIEALPERRAVVVRYRTWPLNLKVACVADEINYRLAAALRGLAVQCGDLIPMVSEEITTPTNNKQHYLYYVLLLVLAFRPSLCFKLATHSYSKEQLLGKAGTEQKGRVARVLLVHAVQAREWANSLLEGMENFDSELAQAINAQPWFENRAHCLPQQHLIGHLSLILVFL